MTQTSQWNFGPAALGTVKFGRNQGVKYPQQFSLPTDEHILDLLKTAQNLGICLLDTAPSYGTSQQRLGQLVQDGYWKICSKVGERFIDGVSYYSFAASDCAEQLTQTRKEMGRTFLDIVLIHSDGMHENFTDLRECLFLLQRQKAEGKIGFLGVSLKHAESLTWLQNEVDVCMVEYGIHMKIEEREKWLQAIEKLPKNVHLMLKKVFNSGNNANSVAAALAVAWQIKPACVVFGTLQPQHLCENLEALHAVIGP